MTLSAGSRLGPYEIVSPLGAGGMGEVYRARDARLKREVAVKVLPPSFARDVDRLRRFEQEAQAAGSLNHPNILAIYDIGTHDGAPYVVSELLEGETLREQLAGGAFSPRRAIGHALQIAQGLAAAHEKGIVHRDLKPENVFVTGDGRVKILDFGLAKLTQPEGGDPTQTNLPTETLGTEPGMVLGTLGYMSPEQVRGKPSDSRSDIFAFGAILYEMLSGRRAFRGETAADTISAILTKDPPDLSETNRKIPEGLERIVDHCLEKSPEGRFQSARDIAFDLEALLQTPLTSGPRPAAGTPWRVFAARSAAWLALPLAVFAFWLGRRATSPAPAAAASSLRPVEFRQLTFQPGQEDFPVLSPDGGSFLYVGSAAGNADIYLQRVGGQNPINLTKDSPVADTQPAFSPSGDLIAFRSERDGGGIFIMGATGENVRRLTDFGFNPAWSPDGKQIAASSETVSHPFARISYADLWAVDAASGQKRLVVSGRERSERGGGDASQASWSPHGNRIAYWGIRGDSGWRDIWTIPAGGGKPVEVTNDVATDWNPVWSPDGRFLYFGSDRGGTLNLWRVPIDEQTGRTLGPPELELLPATYVGHFSFARDGRHLAYRTQEATGNLFRVAFDPGAEKLASLPARVLQTSMVILNLDVSPDAQWIAFRPGFGQEDIFLGRSDGSGLRHMTDDVFRDRGPKFSPDGKRLAFYSNRSGRYDIWSINLDGSGLTPITKGAAHTPWFPNWSPDGSRIAFPDGTNSYVFRQGDSPGEGTIEELPLPPGGGWMQVYGWSPDARRLVGQRQGGPDRNLLIYSLETKKYDDLGPADPGEVSVVGTLGALPVFLQDGKRILYLAPRRRLSIFDLATRQSRPVAGAEGLHITDFVLTKDNRSIYLIDDQLESDIWLATLK
ncbi:MAG TPA: protein kinase [Thermoanaerobaculia bacterium]|nr:protein kinase [Thermoanaerobaculia bacterium]